MELDSLHLFCYFKLLDVLWTSTINLNYHWAEIIWNWPDCIFLFWLPFIPSNWDILICKKRQKWNVWAIKLEKDLQTPTSYFLETWNILCFKTLDFIPHLNNLMKKFLINGKTKFTWNAITWHGFDHQLRCIYQSSSSGLSNITQTTAFLFTRNLSPPYVHINKVREWKVNTCLHEFFLSVFIRESTSANFRFEYNYKYKNRFVQKLLTLSDK